MKYRKSLLHKEGETNREIYEASRPQTNIHSMINEILSMTRTENMRQYKELHQCVT